MALLLPCPDLADLVYAKSLLRCAIIITLPEKLA